MVSVKQRALLALRDHNPFKFINDLAKAEQVQVEMRVELNFRVWKVELDCESEHNPAEFYELWKPLERRGYVRGCGTSTYPPEPLRLGEEFWWRMPQRIYRKHHLSLVFPSEIPPPRHRPENIVRYEVALPNGDA